MIRLICYEDVDAWILGKFARKMQENLALFNVDSDIAKQSTSEAEIAHHIIYYDSPYETFAPVETLMITHLDNEKKISSVKSKLKNFQMGICMSGDHMRMLVSMGFPEERLCYVVPAHDEVIQPRPLVIGIASKTHSDGRKNEWSIVKALSGLPPGSFLLKIMGAGWDKQVNILRSQGHNVKYYSSFSYDLYVNSFMPSLDYWIYFSHDEGSMAFQDAIAADVKIIATPQGYHLDVLGGIDYVINDMHDLHMTLHKIYEQRQQRLGRVSRWTWAEYTWRHLIVWDFLQNANSPDVLAEQKVFTKLLPQLAPSISEALKYELLVRPVAELDALLHASSLAEANQLNNLGNHYKRKALVYYPKSDPLRNDVMKLYPNVEKYLPI